MTWNVDTLHLSEACRVGTEAPRTPAPRKSGILRTLCAAIGARRAPKREEHRGVLALVSPADVHHARVLPGVSPIERLALLGDCA